MTCMENLPPPTGIRSLDRPAQYPVATPTELSQSIEQKHVKNKQYDINDTQWEINAMDVYRRCTTEKNALDL